MPAVKGGWLEFEFERPERPTFGRPDQGLPGGGEGGGEGGWGPEAPVAPDHGFNPAYPDQSLPGEQPGVPPHLPDDQIVLAMHVPGRGWKHRMFPMPTWRPGDGGWQPPAGGVGGRPPERPQPQPPGGPEVQPPRPGLPVRPGQGLPGAGRPPPSVGGGPARPPYQPPQPPAGGIGGRPPQRPGPVYPDQGLPEYPTDPEQPPGAGTPPTP